ncbi:hypothetical protein HETIRDRAFT_427625 [Heterobasidion irregulare TC 32-1]|uniref:Uncharacterized protein n=1 Tax=Heterobasidion irregulare (strain TC 32-1) TaxID=747525 RepID=W4K6C6_HETIT|nr:uncharacterized protein HETIRDRAFT_427625 [Heterobasidion irregulare TC 32-1]ETW80626.1 hypothetical protein HETIRDRAFT_427625 [Heterobasidion irregulare TC 32-1]
MEIATGTDEPTRGKLILSATRDLVTRTTLVSGTLDVNAGTYRRSSFSADPRRGQRSKDMKSTPRQPPVYRRMGEKYIHRTSGSLPLWEGGDTEEPAGRGGDLPDRPHARRSLFARTHRTPHCAVRDRAPPRRRIGAVSARDDGSPHIAARRRAARAGPRSRTVPSRAARGGSFPRRPSIAPAAAHKARVLDDPESTRDQTRRARARPSLTAHLVVFGSLASGAPRVDGEGKSGERGGETETGRRDVG